MKMSTEERDRLFVEQVLGKPTFIHDDRSKNSMYDLRVGSVEAPEIAIECTRDTDERAREVEALLYHGRQIEGDFQQNWEIRFKNETRVKTLRTELPKLLKWLEASEITSTYGLNYSNDLHFDIMKTLDELGIENVSTTSRRSASSVTFLPASIGGAVDEMGDSVPFHVSEFLADPSQEHNLNKLSLANTARREMFIRCDFSSSWLVVSYLTGDFEHLPRLAPVLPEPVTGVWIVYGNRGIRWIDNSWRFVQYVPEEA